MRLPLHTLIVVLSLAAAGCATPEETADPGADDNAGDGTGNTEASPTTDAPTSGQPTGSNETATDEPPASGDDAVSIIDFAFEPAELTVAMGTTVTWTNDDDVTHTVTADDGAFDSGNLPSGETFSHTFDEAGTFPYHCEIHPGMTATVVVE